MLIEKMDGSLAISTGFADQTTKGLEEELKIL